MRKSLAIIVNFEKDQASKFITRFNKVLLPMLDRIQWEFIHYSDLGDPETQARFLSMDGIILTGSYDMLSEPIVFKKFFPLITLIQHFSKPILGICFGHHLIGRAFGFQIQNLPLSEYNSEYETVIPLHLMPFELITKPNITVSVSHHQEICYTPEFDRIFQIYASSRACKLHIIKHRKLPIYGLQFHPENDENAQTFEEGKAIFWNFVSIVENT